MHTYTIMSFYSFVEKKFFKIFVYVLERLCVRTTFDYKVLLQCIYLICLFVFFDILFNLSYTNLVAEVINFILNILSIS